MLFYLTKLAETKIIYLKGDIILICTIFNRSIFLEEKY